MTMRTGLCACVTLLFSGVLALSAATITIDENGHGNIDGTPLPFTVGPDPTPGGGSNALIYTLPFSVTTGGLDLLDGGIPDDVLRFEGNTIVFYSAAPPPPGIALSLADTTTPPTPVPNTGTAPETTGPTGIQTAIYTPTSGQAGFSATTAITYDITSDVPSTVIPEPGTLAMFLPAAALLFCGIFRRRLGSARA